MATITAKPFRLALLQLAGLNATKANNIAVARKAVALAAASKPKPDLIVLPEIWNSPYAVTAFAQYSERVPNVKGGKEVKGTEPEGESIAALREMAREAGVYLIGGALAGLDCWAGGRIADSPGSIPEREDGTDNIYNTLTAYDPSGGCSSRARRGRAELTLGRQHHRKAPQGPPV